MDKKQLHLKLLEAFRSEAAEHVQALSAGLLELEGNPPAARQAQCVEEMFREAHSLKGAARAVELADVESVCQAMEGLFAAAKRGERRLSGALVDALHGAVDLLARSIPRPGETARPRDHDGVRRVLARIQAALDAPAQSSPQVETVTATEPQAQPEYATVAPEDEPATLSATTELLASASTVRIATAKLEAMVFRAEEMRAAKLAAVAHAAELRAAAAEGSGAVKARLEALAAKVERHQRFLGAAADGLLDDVKAMLLLPGASAVELLPKMARDLSHAQGKTVRVQATGADIEIDRRILQDLREPLMHLVRNAVDHGIEPPHVRERAGKPAAGTIAIAFVQHGSRIEIVVSDDGAGIDEQRVREAAQAAGHAAGAGNETLPGDPAQLVFRSGVSTAARVTELSGRGLGLAIVRDKVERLGGVVTLQSQPGHGTTFRMTLPLSLATFRGIHVRVSDRAFIVPTTHVEHALRLREEDVRRVENRETVAWGDALVPLVRLSDVLELPAVEGGGDIVHALLLYAGGEHVAFRVDEVRGEQEVMAKPLGPLLARVRHVAGATVVGEGELVPILHVADLLRSAHREGLAVSAAPVAMPALAQRKSVLVAEDSITSRMLLQNILEAAGYHVETAVDGVEAFTRLKTEGFDAIVSDVEMPRMNGFDLVAKVRADKGLGATPVVLVTALDSTRDRERGVEVGADAYIVKSSFDQSDLLLALERLL
jgi:two-component system chemotaxis sensor kinase CheA